MSTNNNRVSTILRVRPFGSAEADDTSTFESIENSSVRVAKRAFTFDKVYGPEATQHRVFDESVATIIDHVLNGHNGSVLAYGQTASGKTHTMAGQVALPASRVPGDAEGIVPRALRYILDDQAREDVELTYVEIYKRNVHDLFAGRNTLKLLGNGTPINATKKVSHPFGGSLDLLAGADHSGPVRTQGSGASQQGKDPHRQGRVDATVSYDAAPPPRRATAPAPGAESSQQRRLTQCLQWIDEATALRSTGATNMNDQSSRSHSILTITLASGAKLMLVDLAGSETVKKTGASGERLAEAGEINLGLSALAKVVSQLTAGNAEFVAYRDSKLTQMLQTALGGASTTALICNVGPATVHQTETLSTLSFAQRAKLIKQKPSEAKVNQNQALKKQLDTINDVLQRLTRDESLSVADLAKVEIGPDFPPELVKQLNLVRQFAQNGILDSYKSFYDAKQRQKARYIANIREDTAKLARLQANTEEVKEATKAVKAELKEAMATREKNQKIDVAGWNARKDVMRRVGDELTRDTWELQEITGVFKRLKEFGPSSYSTEREIRPWLPPTVAKFVPFAKEKLRKADELSKSVLRTTAKPTTVQKRTTAGKKA